jgi:hypothetical protein
LASCVAFTFAHGNDGRIAIRIDVDAIRTRLLDGECRIGRINLVRFPAKQTADVQIQRSLVQLHLDGVVAHVGERQTRFVTHAKDAGADVQLCTRFLISPHVVGNRQRTI